MVNGENQEARTILVLVASVSLKELSSLVPSLSYALVTGTENRTDRQQLSLSIFAK